MLLSAYDASLSLLVQILPLDDRKLLAQSGPQCDTSNFAEYIQKNMALNELNTGLKLSTHATAHYMRREVRPLPLGCFCMCYAQRKEEGERERTRS